MTARSWIAKLFASRTTRTIRTVPHRARLALGALEDRVVPTLSFAPAVNYGAETVGARSVAVGDFNGDGKQDLATANFFSGTVSVLLNSGTGTFAGTVYYGVGNRTTDRTTSVAVGDFNGDGKQDLAAANLISNSVSVLLGNGDGTFQSAVDYGAGLGPRSVAVGDFNGDGRQDLATANDNSDNVSVLLNTGTGAFASAVNYGAGDGPQSVAVGDFNGDGRQDLAAANTGTDNVSVLLNSGTGTFQSAVNYGAGDGPQSVAVGDFNGDGKQDLAAANTRTDNVSVLPGNGTGTFQSAVNYGAGDTTISVAVGDFDGDGKQDLAAANLISNNVSVLLGNGTGTFQGAVNYGVEALPVSVAVGDFNGDGKQDLATANDQGHNVSVLLNNSTATSTITTTTAVATSVSPSTYGGSVTFTATVTGASTPAGGVNFVIDGGTPLAGTAAGTTGTTATWTFTTSALWAGTHTVEAVYDGTGGFAGSSATLSGGQTVNKADATVVVTPYTVTYDGSPYTATVASINGVRGETGLIVGRVILSSSHINAGTYSDSWSFVGGPNYNDIASTPITNVINKAPSTTTVTINGGPFTYADRPYTPAFVAVTGVGGLLFHPTASYANNVNAGTATAFFNYAGDPNHEPSSDSETFTIGKATAAVVVTPYTVTYDGSPHSATVASITGIHGGQTGAIVGTVTLNTTHTGAGTFSDSWSFTGTANYNDIAGTPITNVINKAGSAVVVTINGGPFTYTGLAQTPATVTVTGAGGLSLAPTASYANNVNAGTATASYTYAGDANHEPDDDSKTFTIGKATATAVVSGYSGGTYDGSAQTQTVTVTGVPSDGQLLSTSLTGTNAGSYGQPWSHSNANYNAVSGTLAFTIAKADAAVVVTPYTVTYDGGPHTATVASITGVFGQTGAAIGAVTLSTTHTDAGTYSDSWSFTGTANYNDIAGTPITNVINKATLTITANDDTKIFGTLKIFGGTAFTQTGLVSGDTITGVTETSPGAPATAAAGTYDIVPGAATGTGMGNYDISYVNGTLTVFPAITVPAAQTAYENVDLPIGGISIGSGLSGSLTLTLGVGHGTLTLGTINGLTVAGDGTGSVSLTGSAADLDAALATLVYRGLKNFGGADALSLTVGDGSISSSASVAITVVSIARQDADLKASVKALQTAKVLTAKQANVLLAALSLKGNSGDVGKVQSFLNDVRGYLQSGVLTQAQADALLGPGNILLLGLTVKYAG